MLVKQNYERLRTRNRAVELEHEKSATVMQRVHCHNLDPEQSPNEWILNGSLIPVAFSNVIDILFYLASE